MSALPPTNNTTIIIDEFIAYATAHLQTVSGIINTISLYPPIGTPGPGIVQWTGYFVPPSQPGGGVTPEQSEFVMSDDDIAEKKKEIAQAKETIDNPNSTAEQRESAIEYTNLITQEIETKQFNSKFRP